MYFKEIFEQVLNNNYISGNKTNKEKLQAILNDSERIALLWSTAPDEMKTVVFVNEFGKVYIDYKKDSYSVNSSEFAFFLPYIDIKKTHYPVITVKGDKIFKGTVKTVDYKYLIKDVKKKAEQSFKNK